MERVLLAGYGDPPWKGMSLADRTACYHVPDVSMAAVNDYQVE